MDLARFDELPGSEIVRAGLADLEAGWDTPEASALRMASLRLGALGILVAPGSDPEPAAHHLYDLLARQDSRDAHSRFNAIARRLASFAGAAEHARAR